MQLSPNNLFRSLNVTVLKLILEQPNHQRTSHVQSLLSVVISVIFIDLAQETVKQLLDHVTHEKGFLSETALVHTDMRKHLLHQQANGVFASRRNVCLFQLVDVLTNRSETLLLCVTARGFLQAMPYDF
jgi:hypothetical protein